MRRFTDYLALPPTISAFERDYLRRMNRIAMVLTVLHVPVIAAVAFFYNTGGPRAIAFTALMVAGPALAYRGLKNPRAVSVVFGIAAMGLGGLLVHFGQGPMQIEMHFYFFVLIALLAVFANPMVNIVAAVTVALHHLILFFVLPASVFNYEASIWAVALHAVFVVLETIAACFVARTFFDNVIGLERIVEARTRELDARNEDMRLVLDNVGQGFLTVDPTGLMSKERSAVLGRWFGPTGERDAVWDYLGSRDPAEREQFRVAWGALSADLLPLEVALEQLPRAVEHGSHSFELDYKPIAEAGRLKKVLLVVSDVTAKVERERLEAEQRDVLQMLHCLSKDRAGFAEFLNEAGAAVAKLGGRAPLRRDEQMRLLHALKNQCSLFGLSSIALLCEQLAARLVETSGLLRPGDLRGLVERWGAVTSKVQALVGARDESVVEVDREAFDALHVAVARAAPKGQILRLLAESRWEPAERRFRRMAEQVRAFAARLGKGEVAVQVEANRLRLPADEWAIFWSALTHATRNAVDHGIEAPEERAALRKPSPGRVALRVRPADEPDTVEIEVEDDGRGVDWVQVATRAAERGLPSSNFEELNDALFYEGLSTRDAMGEESGDGAGLSALRAACEQLGGSVLLWSEPGRGTCLRARLPLPAEGNAHSIRSTPPPYSAPVARAGVKHGTAVPRG